MKKLLLLFIVINIFTLNCYAAPKWSNDARTMFQNNRLIFMEINPRTFNAKDNNGNGIIDFDLGETSGNFVDTSNRLDELQRMGINAIHVMPVTPVGEHRALGTAGSLYALNDFSSINPQLDFPDNNLSVMEEFELFIKECHNRGIRVIVDLPSCGSYDLFLKRPELFYMNEKNEPISPADWFDVYAYKNTGNDGMVNHNLYMAYKSFFDMLLRVKADGVRADVATLRTYDFWKTLISYVRNKNPEFLFLAEASNSWTTPPCKECDFTPYDKLLDAGFDGYYGSYFNYKNWTKVEELGKQVDLDMKLAKKYPDAKSVIGTFTTHDEPSPIMVGGYNYLVQIIWLSSLLPLNPYFMDGIQYGDNFLYEYANKKAEQSYTDNLYYYVHKGKPDIFNFSRQPGGDFPQAQKEIEFALKFREYASDVICHGKFSIVKNKNKSIFVFTRKYHDKTILVILNKEKTKKQVAVINYKGVLKKYNFSVIKAHNNPIIKNDNIKVELEPSEILVLYSKD